jgi:hypothetical protein
MSDPIVARIQALLAKAESTQFEHEAEAFYAKAEELMTKHAVERWQLAQAGNVVEEPVHAIVQYSATDANLPGKRVILSAAALAAGVEVVLCPTTKKVQHAYLIGYRTDVEFAELLYNSLVLQCMRFATPDVRRSKRLLTDFMLGFGTRVYNRVKEQRTTESSGETSTALALVDRSDKVKAAVDDLFAGRTKTVKPAKREQDFAAQRAGVAAGNRADISGGRNNVGGSRGELGKGA